MSTTFLRTLDSLWLIATGLLAFTILLTGSDFAAMQGGVVSRLEVDGSTYLDFVPWIAAAIFIVVVLAGRAFSQLWVRGVAFFAALLLAGYVVTYPVRLFNDRVHLISLSAQPPESAIARFENKFRVATVVFSASGMGTQLAVREDQFIDEMNEFIQIQMQNQAQPSNPTE